MRTVIICNATVELKFPDVLDAFDFETADRTNDIKIETMIELNDVVVRFPQISEAGEIGTTAPLSHEGGQTLTIKKLLLRGVRGVMLPILDEKTRSLVLYTMQKQKLVSSSDPFVVEEKR